MASNDLTTPITNFKASGLQQKVDQLMDTLWTGGVNNPMTSIEQLSYLLFLRLLSEKDDEFAAVDSKYTRIFSGKWSRFAWGNFVTLTGKELSDAVRAAIESIPELPNLSETGRTLFNKATLKIYEVATLRAVIQGINELNLNSAPGVDIKGDMYEYLLSKLSASGANGQFRTPRHIIDLIVKLVNPEPAKTIVDPACGTAGFLVSAFTHIKRAHTKPADLARGLVDASLLKSSQWTFIENQMFTGYDNDSEMVKIAILNLYLHGLEKAQIQYRNPLTTSYDGSYPGRYFDIILANPPFSGKVQEESLLSDLNYNLNTRSTELLFLKWIVDHLAPGGKAGVIVPNGVLFGSTKAATTLREQLLTQCELQAIVSLPSGVFKPYAGVATAALIFQKGKATDSVWFYDLTADGFSLDDKRTKIDADDIPDVLAKYTSREEGPNSYRVSIDKIKESDWSLAAGRYKPQKVEVINHDAPADILKEVLKTEKEITQRAEALLAMLGEKK